VRYRTPSASTVGAGRPEGIEPLTHGFKTQGSCGAPSLLKSSCDLGVFAGGHSRPLGLVLVLRDGFKWVECGNDHPDAFPRVTALQPLKDLQ
jgi:hypothetical protein